MTQSPIDLFGRPSSPNRPRKGSAKRLILWLFSLDMAILLLARTGLLPLPGGAVFVLILPLLILASLYWRLWIGERLDKTAPLWVRRALTIYIVVMLLPFAMVLLGGRQMWDRLPIPVIMWIMIWHLTAFVLTCIAAVLSATICLSKSYKLFIRRADAGPPLTAASSAKNEACLADAADCPGATDEQIGRREMLGWATAAGSLAVVGAGVRVGRHQGGQFLVRRVQIKLPRCPDRLKGLTITHLSDLHVGRLFRPEHLPAMVEAANRLDSDLVTVTGDIVDHSIDYLPAAAEAIAQLDHRHGRFLVMGNHDLIDSGARFVAEMTRREPGFLCERTYDAGGGRREDPGRGVAVGPRRSRVGIARRSPRAGSDRPARSGSARAHHRPGSSSARVRCAGPAGRGPDPVRAHPRRAIQLPHPRHRLVPQRRNADVQIPPRRVPKRIGRPVRDHRGRQLVPGPHQRACRDRADSNNLTGNSRLREPRNDLSWARRSNERKAGKPSIVNLRNSV